MKDSISFFLDFLFCFCLLKVFISLSNDAREGPCATLLDETAIRIIGSRGEVLCLIIRVISDIFESVFIAFSD